MGVLIGFLPDEAVPALFAIGALAVIVGLIRPGVLLGWLGLFVVGAALAPVLAGFAGSLHQLWKLGLLVVVGVVILQGLVSMLFGRRVGDHVTASLLYDVFFRLPARALALVLAATLWFGRGGDDAP